MSVYKPIYPGEPAGLKGVSSRNATRINLVLHIEGERRRIGRVLTLSKSANNNMQALREIGSQVLVELKKGISEYSFTISKMWTRADAFDLLAQGAIFELETLDSGLIVPGSNETGNVEVLDLFKYCAVNSYQQTYTAGQATVASSVSVVTIGQSAGGSLAEPQPET